MKWSRVALATAFASACAYAFACGAFEEGDGGGGGADGGAPDAPPGADGSTAEDATAEGGPDPGDCRTRAFGTPQKITSPITSQASARPADDGFVYVTWDTSPDLAIKLAKRSGTTFTDEGVATLGAVNSSADEFDATIAPASLSMVFGSIRPDAGTMQRLYLSRRGAAGSWGTPKVLAGGGDGVTPVARPFFANATTLYYTEGTAPSRIRKATLDASAVALVGATDVQGSFTGVEDNPVVTADELTMFFRLTGEIFVTTRPSADEAFGPATPVTELNSTFDDYPTWISANGCEIFLFSLRSGKRELWVANR